MKTGGAAIFENDVAKEWVSKPYYAWSIDILVYQLEVVLLCRTMNIEVICAQRALAACEIIARAQSGEWDRNDSTPNLDCWLEIQKPKISPRIARMAVATIDLILSEPSEILSVWRRCRVYSDWIENVESLRSRIRT